MHKKLLILLLAVISPIYAATLASHEVMTDKNNNPITCGVLDEFSKRQVHYYGGYAVESPDRVDGNFVVLGVQIKDWNDDYLSALQKAFSLCKTEQQLGFMETITTDPKNIVNAEKIAADFYGQLRKVKKAYSDYAANLISMAAAKNQQEQIEKNWAEKKALIKSPSDIKTFQDASIYHSDAADIFPVALQPLLKPNNGTYWGKFTIEDMEQSGLIRGKVRIGNTGNSNTAAVLLLSGALSTTAYVWIDTQTAINYGNNLQIGNEITIIGTYSKNYKYVTTAGAGKTAPLVSVKYMK